MIPLRAVILNVVEDQRGAVDQFDGERGREATADVASLCLAHGKAQRGTQHLACDFLSGPSVRIHQTQVIAAHVQDGEGGPSSMEPIASTRILR